MMRFNLNCWFFFFVSFSTGFLIDDKTPTPSNGLTDKHFTTVIEMLVEERKARQILEENVRQLNKELERTSNITSQLAKMDYNKKNESGVLQKHVKLLDEKYEKITQSQTNKYQFLEQELQRTKQELASSKNESSYLRLELEALKGLKSINQLSDLSNVKDQLQKSTNRIHSLEVSQAARGQDFLALFNQTLAIKSDFTRTTVELSKKNNDSAILIMQNMQNMQSANNTSNRRMHTLEQKINLIDNQITVDKMKSHGGTYVRWSRKSCPGNGTELVYSGYAGGGSSSNTGSAAEPVCLPTNPDFVKTNVPYYGKMFGAEYTEVPLFGKNGLDVPCAVCLVKALSVIMIPGKNTCLPGWNLEYHGYLASNYYVHSAAGSFVCIDIQPEYLSGGSSFSGGKLFYPVIAQCGSLRCPPYKQNYPLTCVVCSK